LKAAQSPFRRPQQSFKAARRNLSLPYTLGRRKLASIPGREREECAVPAYDGGAKEREAMTETIQTGYMVFLAEGQEGIGAVRETSPDHIIVYVENGGEFPAPLSAACTTAM
jgi:hypothetical protein